MEPKEQYAALEKFAQDPALAELERRRVLSDFNLFRMLDISGDEEKHSRVLAWLLNPKGNHQLGDAFLKSFLSVATNRKVSGLDLSAARVQLEWRNRVGGQWGFLDILILDEKQRFLCAIENKVWSGEHSRQLTRYRQALKAKFPDFTQCYVFLSPDRKPAQNAIEREHWRPLDYGEICQLVEETLQNLSGSISEDVRVVLRQYANTLRRDILGEREVRELAQKIYTDHSEAVELIYRYKPVDIRVEMRGILWEVIDDNPQWRRGYANHWYTRFYSVDWEGFDTFKTGQTGERGLWGGPGHLLLFEIHLSGNNLSLCLALSPGTNELARRAIYEQVRKRPDVFAPPKRGEVNSSYDLFFMVGQTRLERIVPDPWDKEAVRRKVKTWLSDFAEKRFAAANQSMIDCLTEFEASTHP